MSDQQPYRIFPLGDCAITVDFGNVIDEAINRKIIDLFHALRNDRLPAITEIVPAYSSLTIYYDVFALRNASSPGQTICQWITDQLDKKLQLPLTQTDFLSQLIKIPVCYDQEFAPDISEVASTKNITIDEVIKIHTARTYRVYMLGFLPGFPYMGEIDKQINMPRKTQPRQRVEPGSVGLAGRQTGIYSLASPGGWQIVGKTPLKLFDPHLTPVEGKNYEQSICLLHPGDNVRFYSISKDEFESY